MVSLFGLALVSFGQSSVARWARADARLGATMNSWVKDSQPASLSPAAVVVALERDLLLSSLSRPIGTPPPIAPGAVPATCGPSVRAAAEAVTLVRRGEYVAALRLAPARALLGADDDPPRASDDARAASTASGAPPPLYPGVAAAVARAVAAASDAGDAVELAALELLALACGVAALAAFHQANVTGPPPLAAPPCPLASESTADEPPPTAAAPDDDPIAIRSLSLDGEDVVGRCLLPRYLALARVLLVDRAAPAAETLVRSVNPESPSLVPLEEARGAAPRRVASAGRAVLWPSATLPSDADVEDAKASLGLVHAPPSLAWWAARAVLTHQRVLSGRSATLRAHALGLHAISLAWHAPENRAAPSSSAEAAAAAVIASANLLEAALAEHEYGRVDSAAALVKAAGDAVGLKHAIVGKMGFRTEHQTDAKAQMVLEATLEKAGAFATARTKNIKTGSGSGGGEEEDDDDASLGWSDEDEGDPLADAAPVTNSGDASGVSASAAMARVATELEGLSADGSQVLVAPRLVADADASDAKHSSPPGKKNPRGGPPPLPSAAQAVLLAAAVTVRKSQADDGTRGWSVAPYHEAVQTQSRSRPVLRACAAVLASRHERERPRTRERALLTLEDLVRGLDSRRPGAAQRARYAHATWFPPSAALKKELGDQLVAMGMVGAALELFEEIERWDALVACLTLLGKKQRAADTVRRRLAADPNDPKLWCALGDALEDEAHYLKALEVSGGRHARASRSLARRAASREDWATAATRWTEAMTLSPLFPDGWFSCGYACLKSGREDEALNAFVRCTQTDPENGQAWNNVAALNIRRGAFKAAHVALREATKRVRNSWQTWENLAMVAAKVGRFQQSADALGRVLELTNGAKVHLATLSTLVERCAEARSGVAEWLGVEEREEESERAEEEARERSLGGALRVAKKNTSRDKNDEREEEGKTTEDEEETWEGVGANGAGGDGGDAGDAAADMLGAFFTDSEEEEDDAEETRPEARSANETPPSADHHSANAEGKALSLARSVVLLENAVESVLKRVNAGGSSGERSMRDAADAWRLTAKFHDARGDRVVADEARLKRLRALDASGWRRGDREAFEEYADATLDMCRGRVRRHAEEEEEEEEEEAAAGGEDKNRRRAGLAAARMHARGVIKAADAAGMDEAAPETYAELVKCAEAVEAAEEREEARRGGGC